MKLETELNIALTEFFRPIVAQCVQEAINKISVPTVPATTAPADALPFLSTAEVKRMTGWPDGTLYAKVSQMPPGVVIKGKSKRLLFDRALLVEWLKTPVRL